MHISLQKHEAANQLAATWAADSENKINDVDVNSLTVSSSRSALTWAPSANAWLHTEVSSISSELGSACNVWKAASSCPPRFADETNEVECLCGLLASLCDSLLNCLCLVMLIYSIASLQYIPSFVVFNILTRFSF